MFVFPWCRLELVDDGAAVMGEVLVVQGTRLRNKALSTRARLDGLIFYPMANPGLPRSPAERRALQRMAPLGVASDRMDRNVVADQFMRAASRRGVVTNAVGAQGVWGLKDQLELLLRTYEDASGEAVRRPETHVVTGVQVPKVVEEFAARGLFCIVKAARGSRAEDTQVMSPGTPWVPTGGSEWFVVQELVTAPLLVEECKLDLRCHLLIDLDEARRSRLVGPVIVRRAMTPYVRGEVDAEITNAAYRERRGQRADISALEAVPGLGRPRVAAISEGVQDLVLVLLRAHEWWTRSDDRFTQNRLEQNRLLLWGLDVLVSHEGAGLKFDLLEVNVHPKLCTGTAECEQSVDEMIATDVGEALVRKACSRSSPVATA